VKLGLFRPWAIATGLGALWAIDRDRAQLSKRDSSTGARLRTFALPGTPASLWVGGGSVWVGFDGIGFARVNPSTGHATAYFDGDGVSAFASDGKSVFAISHRDNAIVRVNIRTGKSKLLVRGLAPTQTAATEEAVFASGALWVTGRGLDLLRVDPATGKATATVEIGPAGFGVASTHGKVVVAVYSDEGARRGDPIVASFASVEPTTNSVAATAEAAGYLSGFAVRGPTIYAADTVTGRLTKLPLPGR
jgi:streptogramin lyase